MCSLFIPEEDKVVNIACEHLEPVPPEKGDRVSLVFISLVSAGAWWPCFEINIPKQGLQYLRKLNAIKSNISMDIL